MWHFTLTQGRYEQKFLYNSMMDVTNYLPHMYTTQVEYGHLMACFAQTKELGEYWIIQLYERVLCGDKQLTNEKSALSCSV